MLAQRKISNYLRGRVSDKDAIIDVGCGKGRMLYFFAQFPFRLVDGLEYSGELVAIAQNNFAILRKLRKGQSESFRATLLCMTLTTNTTTSICTTPSMK